MMMATVLALLVLAAPQKNVLYMIADDMRPEWDAYCPSCKLHTPHIDELARTG